MRRDVGLEFDDVNPEEIEDIELANQVKSYQKRSSSGQVVTVRAYTRTSNSAVSDRAKAMPGRPQVAAAGGRFPGDRSVPRFPDAGKAPNSGSSESQPVEYEGLEDTGEVDQEALDREAPRVVAALSNLPSNPELRKLIGIIQGLSQVSLSVAVSTDIEDIELGRGVVQVSGYTYVSPKTGKIVRVNPYSQLRLLINSLGGPSMAARKGITPDLMAKAMPGFDIKGKVFAEKKKPLGKGIPSISRKEVAAKVNKLDLDREFTLPKPIKGEDYLKKAMSTSHPLEAVRNGKEGSIVQLGNQAWLRGLDGLWYKNPRGTTKGIDDRTLTKRIASKGGDVSFRTSTPISRKNYNSKVDYSVLADTGSSTQLIKAYKSLEPTFRNMPDGVADSLSGRISVNHSTETRDRNLASLSTVISSKSDNFLPKMAVRSNPGLDKEVMKAIPRQQKSGYSVPSTLHPSEHVMAKATAPYVEELLRQRAPSDMTDRMYDRLNKAYDKTVKDGGDYNGLTGREGWVARLTGDRDKEISKTIKDGLSFSALESPEEFLSEAWAEFVGNPEPRPIAKEISKAFQKGMEEFSDYLFKNNWYDAGDIPDRVYTKTTAKPVEKRIAEAVDGDSYRVNTTYLSPRDMRSVLMNKSDYVDIRDANGDPTFDAEIKRVGNTVEIGALEYPKVDADSMPTGIPEGLKYIDVDREFFYSPSDTLAKGPSNQKFLADRIDMDKATKAISAIEEKSFYEGVRRFEATAKAGQDSLIYAKAGYHFDPATTDVSDISNVLNNIQAALDGSAWEMKEGHWTIPKKERMSTQRKLNAMQARISDHPETWPTPKDIASIGKYNITDKSLGEEAISGMSWRAVKEISGDKYPEWQTTIHDLPDFDKPLEVPTVKIPTEPTASLINRASRSINKEIDTTPDTNPKIQNRLEAMNSRDAFTSLMDTVANKYKDRYPDLITTSTPKNGGVEYSFGNPDSPVFKASLTFKKDEAVMNLHLTNQKDYDASLQSAAFEVLDSWESSIQQSKVNKIRVIPPTDDNGISNYSLAAGAYDWDNPPSKEVLQKALSDASKKQVEASRNSLNRYLEKVFSAREAEITLEDMQRKQADMDKFVEGIQSQLDKHVGSLMSQYGTSNSPTPFQLAQLGKKQANDVNSIISSSPGDPSAKYNAKNFPDPTTVNARPLSTRKIDKEESTTAFQAMLDYDGDPTKDSRVEFMAKQLLTLGGYEWLKSAEGFWDWGTDTSNPTARKATVGLLYLLLRLIPASVMRGATLALVNQVTKKIQSPRPEDWPSREEIIDVIEDIENKLPSGTNLNKLKGKI